MCAVHASEPYFELCGIKSKPTNSACDSESRDSYKKGSYKKETVYFLRHSVFFQIHCKITWEDNAFSS